MVTENTNICDICGMYVNLGHHMSLIFLMIRFTCIYVQLEGCVMADFGWVHFEQLLLKHLHSTS